MLIGRILGWLLVAGAIGTGAGDLLAWQESGVFRLTAAGELWFRFSPDSLNLAQALIQRYVSAEVWQSYVQTVLLWPAVAVLAVPGLVLLVLFRRR